MSEDKYFEKFKSLGKYLAYADMVDLLDEVIMQYHTEAKQGFRSWKETEQIIDALTYVSNIASIRRRGNLKKC